MRHLLLPFLVLLIAVAGGPSGCSDDEPDPVIPDDPTPDPHEGIDEIVFRVFVDDADGAESLRWIGDPSGPADASPEPTDRPYVPFGRAFRVEWDVDAAGAPVTGTRFRVYRDERESFFLPDAGPDSVAFDDTRSFRFANAVSPDAVDPANCATGPSCYGDVRLDSGRVALEVQSVNADGRVIDTEQTLVIEVNYPPDVFLVDAPADPDSSFAFPAFVVELEEGGRIERALASGDTIPTGSRVRVKLRGRDRFDGVAPVDSFCCDERFDDTVPAIRFQGRASLTLRNGFGTPTTVDTFFGPVLQDSVLWIDTGPGDYELELQAVDEHLRRGEPVTFHFTAGFPPRAPVGTPEDGRAIVLLPPDQAPPLVDGVPAYTRVAQTRSFDAEAGRWVLDGDIDQTGTSYRIPIRITGRADPRAAAVRDRPGAYTDLPRAFAYEIVSAYDPDNDIAQGAGDRLDFFVDAPVIGELTLDSGDLGVYDGIDVFVPDAFWDFPGLYDSTLVEVGGPEPQELTVEVGDRVRRDLGAHTYRLRARTTRGRSVFTQPAPLPDGLEDPDSSFEVGAFPRFGLLSPIADQSFSIQLTLEVDGAEVLWPPLESGLPVASGPSRD